MNELLFIMEIGEKEPLVQTDFFESWQMPGDDYYEAQEPETSEVSSACVTEKEDDSLDDCWLLEDYKPKNLKEAFACMQELFDDPEREGRKNLQEDILDDWTYIQPGNLQKQFATIQPARTLGVGGPYEDAKPTDHMVVLKDPLDSDSTEDDEDWGSIIH